LTGSLLDTKQEAMLSETNYTTFPLYGNFITYQSQKYFSLKCT